MDTNSLNLAAARARRLILRMLEAHPQGHIGGAYSAIEILTYLYRHEMLSDPANPRDPDRDRFLLSAGHKAMAQYAVLAEAGYFAPDVLDGWGSLGAAVPGHPDMAKLPGIEANTGALGHGLPIAVGMALGLRMSGRRRRVFVLLGDGELPEGSNWEGASMAAHHKVDNLTAIVDINGFQISGRTCDVMNMEPIAAKFEAFGWSVLEIDGHDFSQLHGALSAAARTPGKPLAVVARTEKGRGITSIQGTAQSHYWKPSPPALASAIAEIDAVIQYHQEFAQ